MTAGQCIFIYAVIFIFRRRGVSDLEKNLLNARVNLVKK
jgi:hypothetical protein